MLHPGLYEQIINTALNNELAAISAARRRIPISARLAALSTRQLPDEHHVAFGQGDSRKVPEENEQIGRRLTAHVDKRRSFKYN